MLSQSRIGRFTSSEIHILMKNGRGGKRSTATDTYIEDKRIEKRLGRPLNADLSSRPTVWGHVCENRVYQSLDQLQYIYCSNETILHPEIECWAGTPDFTTINSVVDAKCPYTLKAFAQLADIAIAKDLEKFKATKPEYYWQLVSNSILANKPKAELIAYCPFKSELPEIKEMVEGFDGDQNKYAWIFFADDEDLPYLIDGGYYQNKYSFVFDVPQEDKDLLTAKVVEAGKELSV